MLISCNKADTSYYKQSICSIDNTGFIFKAEKENKNSHSISVDEYGITFKSNTIGKFANELNKSNIFYYSGEKENGMFSYKSMIMKSPIELGIINYSCWAEFKKRYNDRIGFNEKYKKLTRR